MVGELVERHAEKVHEHDLGNRSQAGDRGADAGAHDRLLGDGRVAHPVLAVLRRQPVGHVEHASAGGVGDVLAEHEDPVVLRHRLVHCLVDRVAERQPLVRLGVLAGLGDVGR